MLQAMLGDGAAVAQSPGLVPPGGLGQAEAVLPVRRHRPRRRGSGSLRLEMNRERVEEPTGNLIQFPGVPSVQWSQIFTC